MKKNYKFTRINLIFLLILLIGFIPTFSNLLFGDFKVKKSRFFNTKSSDWWNLTGNPIFIDDTAPYEPSSITWAEAVAQDWCSGLGTFASPYIIENITINCNQTNYGINIRDSSVYFRIQNCIIFNHSYSSGSGAIYLYSSSKGTIHNNTIHSGGQGVMSYLIRNFTITENIIINNIGRAMVLYGYGNFSIISNTLESGIDFTGDDNTIVGNTIWSSGGGGDGIESTSERHNITGNTIYNFTHGIYLKWSEGQIVEGNYIYENDYGIYLDDVSNSNFTSNELYDNKKSGIYFETVCEDNNFTDNILTGSGVGIDYGLSFEDLIKYEPIDSSNTMNSRPIYFYVNETGLTAEKFTNAGQIILINCNNSFISNANTSYSTEGSSLFYCNNITMTGCDMSHNKRIGLRIKNGAYNKLLYSTVNDNGAIIAEGGLAIEDSPYTYLYNNTITNSYREGISLIHSNHSSIINNIIKNNGIHSGGDGIQLWSWYCEIDGNTVNNNSDIGIRSEGKFNNITNNIANENWAGFVINQEYNIISGNSANYNYYHGFVIGENHNEISWNNATGNGEDGFHFSLTDFHTLTNNTAINNSWSGFHFEYCNNITMIDNKATDHTWRGIYVEDGFNYTIINNELLNNEDGVEADDSAYFLISNNVMRGDDGVRGIRLNHSIIKENDMDGCGVSISESKDNHITDNRMNNGHNTLSLSYCFDAVVNNNEINHNTQRGLWIHSCDNIEILNNNASFNGEYGLFADESTNLEITGNIFNNNSYHGIYFWNVSDSIISNNAINGNDQNGICLFGESTGNIVSYNVLIWNNQCIVEKESTGNTIFGNVCENRPQRPPTNGDGTPPIHGYDLLILAIISITLFIYLIKKRRNKIMLN